MQEVWLIKKFAKDIDSSNITHDQAAMLAENFYSKMKRNISLPQIAV